MLDPIKVSILTPGMGDDGKLQDTGVPAALVNAYFTRFGIVPTRVTDFQVMFLFSIGITKGKWGTLITNLLSFKRALRCQRSGRPTCCRSSPRSTARAIATSGLRDLGTEMFDYLKKNNPGELLNRAYETLPAPAMTPRAAYPAHRDERRRARAGRRRSRTASPRTPSCRTRRAFRC